MCLGIVDLLYEIIQYHQWYTLINYTNIFTIPLSTNHNNIHQASVIILIADQSTNPKKLYSSLYLPPITYDMNLLRTLLSLLNPPPLLPIHQRLWLRLTFTPNYMKCLPILMQNVINEMKNLINKTQNLTNNMKNWLISHKCHFAYQRIPRYSNNNIPSFNQNYMTTWKKAITLPHHMMDSLRTWLPII